MSFILLFILVYFLVFPLKIRIYLTNETLQIYLYKFCVLDQELFQAMKEIQEVTIENIQNNLISKEDLIYILPFFLLVDKLKSLYLLLCPLMITLMRYLK